MVEGTRQAKRLKKREKMKPPRNPGQADSHGAPGALGKNLSASRVVLPDKAGRSAADTQAGQEFGLSALQHAQVSRAVFEQGQIGVAIVGVDGRIEHANRALADLLHYEREELAGRTLKSLVRGERARNSHGGIEMLPDMRRATPAVNQLERKSGEEIPCRMASYSIQNRNGKIGHFLVFFTDARPAEDTKERNVFEKGFYQSQALQALGTLAGGVAHDFNNALEVIIGFASLARIRLSAADPLHEPLKIIEESAKGAATLARQLLDASQNKTDEERDIDAEEVVNAVIAIIRRTFDRKIHIEDRIAPRLPSIKGIHNLLEQAILNLCINARDAMPEGGTLTLEATCQVLNAGDPRRPPSSQPGNYVRISVDDNGVGMTVEVMEQIFVPLYTTKEPGRGSGLGLVMVDRIVKEAQGFVSVASKPGEGSRFSLYLPAVLSGTSRTVRPLHKQLVAGRGRVLVVDDEPRVLEFLEKGLTRLGYEVVPAESGNKACEIYSRQCQEINCVLLDLIMPGMSGLQTYGRLQEINPRVKVILSSGYSSGSVKREAVEAGSPEFLEKPYTLEELSVALQKIQQN